jgi:hypothetical protein
VIGVVEVVEVVESGFYLRIKRKFVIYGVCTLKMTQLSHFLLVEIGV